VQSNNILTLLRNPDAQTFLTKERGQPVAELAMQYHGKPLTFNLKHALSLLAIYNKALQKNPSLFFKILPALDEKSYQQCSSDRCAKYKAGLLTDNLNILDLTGGIGIDDFFLAKAGHKVVSYDLDLDVHKMAQYNFNLLEVDRIKRIQGDATSGVDFNEFDAVMVDPDRRTGQERSIILEHCSPNVVALQEDVLKSSTLLTKASPMVDLAYAVNRLRNLKEIHVVSLKREIKEVVFIQEPNYSGLPMCYAIELSSEKPIVVKGPYTAAGTVTSNNIASFLMVPQVNAIKSTVCFSVAKEKDMTFRGNIHQPLFFSELDYHFPLFDRFKILDEMPYQSKSLKKKLRSLEITEAEIRCKSTPLNATEIAKKFNLAPSIENHIFIYQFESNYRCIIAKRI
jgi:precorrin-6B methylase 2